MTINTVRNGGALNVTLEGRLDSNTAPMLAEKLEDLSGVSELVLDMDKLEYVSSAGLRVILKAQKTMQQQGSLKLINVNSIIMEILELTGFSDILQIEAK